MLDEQDVATFRAFGFVVLRECLSQAELQLLAGIFACTLSSASAFNGFGDAGTQLLLYPEDSNPGLVPFIVHPRILEAMRAIWGRPCLYIGSYLWSNRDDAHWHTPGAPGEEIPVVRVTINLDSTSAEQGALHVIPGTHFPQWNRGLFQALGRFEKAGNRLRLDSHSVPGAVVLPTLPGDVILWWNRLWHAAFKRQDGKPRRALFLSYIPDPQEDVNLADTLRRTVKSGLTRARPYLYGKCLTSLQDSEIQGMIARLEALGVENIRPNPERSLFALIENDVDRNVG